MKRHHEMPFGVECIADRNVRARVWAPNATRVDFLLHGAPSTALEMKSTGQGWFELVASAIHGARYNFRIDGERLVPDPASRFQPEGVHGPSQIIDPNSYDWQDVAWRGRLWHEAVIYELHAGTFTPQGTFLAAAEKLDYLADLGVTAVELMPVSSFPGDRNWGYDGVLPFAPADAYGRPEDLKRFIDSAHSRNLMVFLDVVYNHFGPEGNYLPLYAPQFFTDRHKTPWGPAINFDGPCNRTVRDYFVHNALYWLNEYHLDGLRFDAVHAFKDNSHPDILEEIAMEVRQKLGGDRQIHLVLENDDNAAHFLRRDSRRQACFYTAQWNDDIHHAAHVLVTGETDGYYHDYGEEAVRHLGRCLAEGFSFQGDISPYRNGAHRGEVSRELPPEAFVSFLQNHDQVGNRAYGERIVRLSKTEVLRAMLSVLLLAPSPPLLFMGEEFGATTPFLFFCDFGRDLGPKVTEGRRSEFARFVQFSTPEAQSKLPDPEAVTTFSESKLDWQSVNRESHQKWLHFYRDILKIRQRDIVPIICDIQPGRATWEIVEGGVLSVTWPLRNRGSLQLRANFSSREVFTTGTSRSSRILHAEPEWIIASETLPPSSAIWMLKE